MRILIADDDVALALQVASRLRAAGYDVVHAQDALQTWTAVLRNTPDLILLDLGMPGGTGVEVLRRLRGSPMTWKLPIVVVSGNEDPEVEKTVRSLGVQEYIRKPAPFERVLAAVESSLGASSSR